MSERQCAAVLDLLAQERAEILAGRLAGLEGTAQRKQSLLERLDPGRVSASDLQRLQEGLQRNQAMLTAAAEGLHEAMIKLASIRRVAGGFESYDSNGQRADMDVGRPAFERKA